MCCMTNSIFLGFYGEDLKSSIVVVFASTIFLILHMKPNKIKIAFKLRRINLGKVKFSFNFDLGWLSKNYYCVFLSCMQIFVDVVIFFWWWVKVQKRSFW